MVSYRNWTLVYPLNVLCLIHSFTLRRLKAESKTSHWPFISCIIVTWFFTTALPLKKTRGSLEFIHSFGRNEHGHRVWPVLLPRRPQSTYWTHCSQETYLRNIPTQNDYLWFTTTSSILSLFILCFTWCKWQNRCHVTLLTQVQTAFYFTFNEPDSRCKKCLSGNLMLWKRGCFCHGSRQPL